MNDNLRQLFEDWKADALKADILAEARARNAKLKRVGKEWVGPCPACGGKDRFGVNPQKRVFVCRGSIGGDVIAMVMHLDGCDFLKACEKLTSRPSPRGEGRELTATEKDELNRRRDERDAEAMRRAEAEEREREGSADDARQIWARDVRPLAGTLAEKYLQGRGIPMPPMGWPDDAVGFHPGLAYRLDPSIDKPRFPALVGRIVDIVEETIAVHAVFLEPDGKKLKRDPNKLTYGPMLGGAIRLGGTGPHVDTCEGLETGFGVWALTGHRRPVWPTLGTSGLVNVEFPLSVRRVTDWPDGDLAMKRDRESGEYVPTEIGAGQKAARTLGDRLRSTGIKFSMVDPPEGGDFLDVWQAVSGSLA